MTQGSICGSVQCNVCMMGLYCRRTQGHGGHCNESGDAAAGMTAAIDRLVQERLA